MAPVFVIHVLAREGAEPRLHLRLEVGGVLKCWALSERPVPDPRRDGRAVRTHDRPLHRAGFEGIAPEDEDGGGAVVICDRGAYRNVTIRDAEALPMEEAVALGSVDVVLEGEKLRGGWTLRRTGPPGADWLLSKVDDEAADASLDPLSTEPVSIVSGRTAAEVAAEAAETEDPDRPPPSA